MPLEELVTLAFWPESGACQVPVGEKMAASEKSLAGKQEPEGGRGGGLWSNSSATSLPCPVSLGEHAREELCLMGSLHPEQRLELE